MLKSDQKRSYSTARISNVAAACNNNPFILGKGFEVSCRSAVTIIEFVDVINISFRILCCNCSNSDCFSMISVPLYGMLCTYLHSIIKCLIQVCTFSFWPHNRSRAEVFWKLPQMSAINIASNFGHMLQIKVA